VSRPIKDTVDYFFHDVKQGKTLRILQSKYGNDGYAVWFKTLEILGSSNGHFYDFNNPLEREDMVAYMGVSEGLCMQIFSTLAELGKLDKHLLEAKILWSMKFIERLTPLYERRKGSVPMKPPTKTELMSAETHRVEKSRVEKSREEDVDRNLHLTGTDPELKECLRLLSSVKGYPFDVTKDGPALARLIKDFPERDPVRVLKAWPDYLLDNPFKANANHRSQLRSTFEFNQKYDKCCRIQSSHETGQFAEIIEEARKHGLAT